MKETYSAILEINGKRVHTERILSIPFMWYEGNYSCDCNRSLFANKVDSTIEVLDCGNTIKLIYLE